MTSSNTFVAQWRPINNLVLTFNLNNGFVNYSSNSIIHTFPDSSLAGEQRITMARVPNPTRPGYVFDGWIHTQGHPTMLGLRPNVDVANHVMIVNNTFEARWRPNNNWVLTFDLNNGFYNSTTGLRTGLITTNIAIPSTGGGVPITIVRVPTPTRPGYVFDGWHQTSGTPVLAGSPSNAQVAGHIMLSSTTFVAQWRPINNWMLTFNLNFGSYNGNPGPITTNITIPATGGVLITYGRVPIPTRPGYVFDGWHHTSGHPTMAGRPTRSQVAAHVMTSSNTFVAQWRPVSNWTLTFNLNHGFYNGSTAPITTSIAVPSAGGVLITYGRVPTPTRPGYVFDGWHHTSGHPTMAGRPTRSQVAAHVMTSSNTFVAQWRPVANWALTFNLNGGFHNGSTVPITTSIAVPSSGGVFILYGRVPVPTRPGFVFAGWVQQSGLPAMLPGARTRSQVANHVMTSSNTFIAQWTPQWVSGNIPTTQFNARFMIGYPDGNFRPYGLVTRAEAAALLVRTMSTNFGVMARTQHNDRVRFNDVGIYDWHFRYINVAYSHGLLQGFPDGSFRPNDPITREQFAWMLSRTTNARTSQNLHHINSAVINNWTLNHAYTVLSTGLMRGDGAGAFRPFTSLTRAEAAAAISRTLGRNNTNARSIQGVTSTVHVFPDTANRQAWHFYYILEATNSRWFIKNGMEELWIEVIAYN